MSQNIHCNPILRIDGKEVVYCSQVSFNDQGNNLVQTLKAELTEPDLENKSLFGKKVEFYLNYGSIDGVPIFRGYIHDFRVTDRGISISARDPRGLLSGNDSLPISITDTNNYDGRTLTQFLFDVIENKLNATTTLMSTEYLSDVDKPVYMTGVRRNDSSAYKIVIDLLKNHFNEDDSFSIFTYSAGIIHGPENSSIVFIKKKDIDTEAHSTSLSYNDGIRALSYKERQVPTYGIAYSTEKEGIDGVFEYGNRATGAVGIRVRGKYNSKAEAVEAARTAVISAKDDKYDLDIEVSKGHYLGLDSLVNVNVPDNNIKGTYRVSSKQITYSDVGVSCKLTLNKKPILISDYIV